MDCVILRFIPDVNGQGGFRPIFRIYGQDPFSVDDKKAKLLYSTPKKGKHLRFFKQTECELVKIDINCHVQGDIVIECLSLNDDMEREVMMFRVVFNTAFIRSNILMLNRDEVDTLWHIKEFPKGFRVELLFSDMDTASSVDLMDFSRLEEKDGLPIEVFSKVHEFFNQVDWVDQTDATHNMLQHLAIANAVQERTDEIPSPRPQGFSPKSIQDIAKHAAIENSGKFKLSSMSEIETINTPEKPPADSVKKFIAEDLHSVLQINTTSEDAKFSCQESPSLKLVHHSATVKPLVDGSNFSENAEEKGLPTGKNGKVISVLPSTPSPPRPTRQQLTLTGAPPPPPPLPVVSYEHSEELQHSVVQQTEPFSQGNSWMSLAGSTLHQTTVNEKHPITQPPSPPSLPSASHVCAPRLPPMQHSNENTVTIVLPPIPPSPPTPIFPAASPSPPPIPQSNGISAIRSPPPAPPRFPTASASHVSPLSTKPPPPPPPPSGQSWALSAPPPPPPPPPPPDQNRAQLAPPPPPQPSGQSRTPSAPPPPVLPSGQNRAPSAPPPPPLPSGQNRGPSAPPPPPPKLGTSLSLSPSNNVPPTPALPTGSLSSGKGRMLRVNSKNSSTKKLKPYHWLKLTRAVNGSLWAETQMSSEASKAPDIDIKELENLFSASVPEQAAKSRLNSSRGPKLEKVQLVNYDQ